MDAGIKERIEGHLGAVVAMRRVHRGYTPAERWIVRTATGAAFAKVATTPYTAAALRAEQRVYASISADWMPAFLGFDAHPERPILLLEDLSAAHWPPPWRPGDVERVRDALADVARTRCDAPPLDRAELRGWADVARDPAPFASLGLCTAAWLDRALPALVRAEQQTPLEGDDLLHNDVRSDNLALLPDRVVFVDWNFASRGPAALDRAAWAPSLRLEGGPPPEAADADAYAVVIAGFFAARAGLPPIPDAPRVRPFQLQQLRVALPWACRVLGLPAPDGGA